LSGTAAVCTSAGSPQDRRARAGFASGSALGTDGNAAPHAAGEFRAGAVYLVTARSPGPAASGPGWPARSGRIGMAGRSAAAGFPAGGGRCRCPGVRAGGRWPRLPRRLPVCRWWPL